MRRRDSNDLTGQLLYCVERTGSLMDKMLVKVGVLPGTWGAARKVT